LIEYRKRLWAWILTDIGESAVVPIVGGALDGTHETACVFPSTDLVPKALIGEP
jgi:hypothetical protein